MGLTVFPNGVQTDQDGVLYAEITDLGTAASSFSAALPFDVEITGAYVTATATVDVDTVVTFEIAGVAVTSLAATVLTAGIAAGDAFAAVAPTALNSLDAGIAIEVITDGASTTASKGIVGITYKRV
jgi:hypothetical protein